MSTSDSRAHAAARPRGSVRASPLARTTRRLALPVLTAVGAALVACGERSGTSQGGAVGEAAATDSASESAQAARAIAAATAGPDAGVASREAVGHGGPGGLPFSVTLRTQGATAAWHRPIGTRTFEVALRPAPLAQDPCTSCHVGASVSRTAAADAHQNIGTAHPSEARGTCAVCHAPADVARLVLQSGETATLEEAYRLCAQCHSTEVESWAGGAHGKRLVGWRGPRVVMGCADCHDPHAPATPRRIPFAGPVLP